MDRMKRGILRIYGELELSRKIRLSLIVLIVPLLMVFVILFLSMYRYNQQYDRIIANASKAGRFSIRFKEEFDYKIYLLIAGHSSFAEQDPYADIEAARSITQDLIDNASGEENRLRANNIMNMLGNLEKYARRIEENKRVGGFYDENISIWENDVQLVTGWIQLRVLEYTYFETVGMEQLRAQMSASLNGLMLIGALVIAGLFGVAIFVSIVIPKSIAKPICDIKDVTNQVARGDLGARVPAVRGVEVRELACSLNSMIEKIGQLVGDVELKQIKLREAELELLQSQINPHFLYNTLDTIIWLSEAGRQKEVVDVVGALSNFFRTSLNHGNGVVTLAQEEEHVRSYMQIQQVRYQDILEYEIDIPERLKNALVPKLTLQPLVENALYHGVKNRRSKGRIRVYAQQEGGDACIYVTDNGMGMQPERLSEVLAQMNQGAQEERGNDSYALYNVNERLRLKFGERYGLCIESIYGEGTCVSFRVPLS